MSVIVHVARQAIASNLKHNKNDPAIIIKRGRKSERFHKVKLIGNAEILMGEQLSCGARVYIIADDAEGFVNEA
jgi:hypothetical protein